MEQTYAIGLHNHYGTEEGNIFLRVNLQLVMLNSFYKNSVRKDGPLNNYKTICGVSLNALKGGLRHMSYSVIFSLGLEADKHYVPS